MNQQLFVQKEFFLLQLLQEKHLKFVLLLLLNQILPSGQVELVVILFALLFDWPLFRFALKDYQ
jgi:hypothetical protein